MPSAAKGSKNQTPAPSPTVAPSPGVTPNSEGQQAGAETQPFLFRTERVEDPDLVKELQAANVEYAAARPGLISQLLLGWVLPIVFMVGIWTFLTRRLNPSTAGVASAGDARRQKLAGHKPRPS